MFEFILNLLGRVQIQYGLPNELKYKEMGAKRKENCVRKKPKM
jgi:hypothetical protein